MDNLTKDRKKFNRQIINFHAGCLHKRKTQQFDTQSMEYVNVCQDCAQQVI